MAARHGNLEALQALLGAGAHREARHPQEVDEYAAEGSEGAASTNE